MHSSISFSALSFVWLLPLVNLLPFDFEQKTATFLVLFTYFSTSIIYELRNEDISLLGLTNITRLCNNISANGSASIIFCLALNELHHVFLYSLMTLLCSGIRITMISLFLVTGGLILCSRVLMNTENINVTRQTKTSLSEFFLTFVVCHILPVVQYFSQTPEYLSVEWKTHATIYIFCDFPMHLIVIYDLVLLVGRKKQSDPTARSDFNDCAHVSPNWLSKLDGYCLQRIVQQITYFKDFVTFSEVCHSTRDVCSNMEWDGGPKPPCLVLSEKPGCSSRPFFSLHNRNVFVLDLPATIGRCIWGSPHGWLVTVGPELDSQLINPISQVCVNLPPFSTMLNQLARGNRFHKVQNLFVLQTKIHPRKFLIIAILHPGHQLVFTRCPGDIGEWAFVSNPKEFFFRSVAYFEHQLYALCDNGSLIRIDFNGSIAARAEFVASHPIREYVGYQPHHEKTRRAYLVSSQDDLFGVFRYSSKDIGFERTVQFFVYKFDFGSLEWEPEWSIGDKAFFVGSGNSWGISLADTVNCSSNSIFYSDDTEGGLGLDYGIYDLETLKTELLRFGANVPRSQPLATWLTPSLTPSTFC